MRAVIDQRSRPVRTRFLLAPRLYGEGSTLSPEAAARTPFSLWSSMSGPGDAGAVVVEGRMDQEARTGGTGRIRTLLSELDVIAGSVAARPVEVVRARLVELLGTRSGRT